MNNNNYNLSSKLSLAFLGADFKPNNLLNPSVYNPRVGPIRGEAIARCCAPVETLSKSILNSPLDSKFEAKLPTATTVAYNGT